MRRIDVDITYAFTFDVDESQKGEWLFDGTVEEALQSVADSILAYGGGVENMIEGFGYVANHYYKPDDPERQPWSGITLIGYDQTNIL